MCGRHFDQRHAWREGRSVEPSGRLLPLQWQENGWRRVRRSDRIGAQGEGAAQSAPVTGVSLPCLPGNQAEAASCSPWKHPNAFPFTSLIISITCLILTADPRPADISAGAGEKDKSVQRINPCSSASAPASAPASGDGGSGPASGSRTAPPSRHSSLLPFLQEFR